MAAMCASNIWWISTERQADHRKINPHCLTPAEWQDKLRRKDAFALRVAAEPKLWLKGGPDALAAMGG